MKLHLLGSILCLVAVLGLVGCSRQSPKGGPGADKANKGDSKAPKDDPDNTFTIKVPPGNTNITQGEQREVTATVSRGSNFDADVKLSFKAPKGLEVTPSSASAKKGGDDVMVTVKAAPDAPPGTTNIDVTGTSGSGSPTSVKMGIEIKKKD